MCYSGDLAGSEAVYFCDDGYRLEETVPDNVYLVDSGMELQLSVHLKVVIIVILCMIASNPVNS